MADAPAAQAVELTNGTWQVDPAGSEIGFSVRTFWGILPVKGTFERFSGALNVRDDGADGELKIEAASLTTKNKTRDKHLRSADFFDVENHPEVVFALTSISFDGAGAKVGGTLSVGEASLPLELAADVSHSDGGHVKLAASTRVPRTQAGMTWNRAGMIAGDADLHVELTLVLQ
jgi:polyisoprenoid-binding protein YceI